MMKRISAVEVVVGATSENSRPMLEQYQVVADSSLLAIRVLYTTNMLLDFEVMKKLPTAVGSF